MNRTLCRRENDFEEFEYRMNFQFLKSSLFMASAAEQAAKKVPLEPPTDQQHHHHHCHSVWWAGMLHTLFPSMSLFSSCSFVGQDQEKKVFCHLAKKELLSFKTWDFEELLLPRMLQLYTPPSSLSVCVCCAHLSTKNTPIQQKLSQQQRILTPLCLFPKTHKGPTFCITIHYSS